MHPFIKILQEIAKSAAAFPVQELLPKISGNYGYIFLLIFAIIANIVDCKPGVIKTRTPAQQSCRR